MYMYMYMYSTYLEYLTIHVHALFDKYMYNRIAYCTLKLTMCLWQVINYIVFTMGRTGTEFH